MDETPQEKKKQQYLKKLLATSLPLKHYGFLSHTYFISQSGYPTIVYSSEKCKVKFLLDTDRYNRHSLFIEYGRLHAPDDESIMKWHGTECRCWHRINIILRFLDGIPPQKAAKSLFERPQIIEEFKQSELAQKANNNAEKQALLHAAIWQNYEGRLFDLFDLHRTDIWDNFTRFIKEFHKLSPLKVDVSPPEDQVC